MMGWVSGASSNMQFNINDVVGLYIKLRDHKAGITAEAEARANAITEQMMKLEAWLKQQADQLGTTQFKTPNGIAFFKTNDYTTVADWDAVLDFVKATGAYDLLEKRVAKTAVRSYLDEHKQLPPGINYGTKLVLGIQKPRAKTDEILGGANATEE